jgi:hypothetical protein
VDSLANGDADVAACNGYVTACDGDGASCVAHRVTYAVANRHGAANCDAGPCVDP